MYFLFNVMLIDPFKRQIIGHLTYKNKIMGKLNFHIYHVACHGIRTKDISETTYITEMLSASRMAQEVMYFLLVCVMFF